MKKTTFKAQLFIGIMMIVVGNILALFLHRGSFANIAWILYGLVWILNPVFPERYGNDAKKAKAVVRIVGVICILAGIFTRYVV